MIRKIFRILTALPLCAFMLIACASPEAPVVPDTDTAPAVSSDSVPDTAASGTPDETTAEPADDGMLHIIDGGTSDFSVIRPDNGSDIIINAAVAFHRAASEATGTTLKLGTDWFKKGEEPAPDTCEIIIGNADRDASKQLNAAVADHCFTIKVTGNKVLIAGATELLTARAVEYFIAEYLGNPEYTAFGKLLLPRELNVTQGPFEPGMTDLINSSDSYTTVQKKVLTIPGSDNYKIMQGGCTDGKYCYFAMENNTFPEGSHHSYIYKYEVATWKPAGRSEALPLDHSNDICYNPDTNELVVVHNAPNRTKISIVDPETLTVKEVKTIKYEIFAISYSPVRKQYVIGLSHGQNFAVLDADFERVRLCTVKSTGYTTQGVECDESFIYFVQYNQNVIMIYDWDGKLITRVDMTLAGVEPENISLKDMKFYIGCNNATWTGGEIYELEIVKK